VSGQSYFIAWLVYLTGLVGLLALGWYLTRRWPAWGRWPVRTTVAALLLMPWTVAPGHWELAPAWVVSLFDGLIQEEVDVWRAGGPLLAVTLLGLALGLAQWWRLKRIEAHD
jgi:hypothetical protein